MTLASPGTTVRAGAALTAEATDAETGIRNLTIQYLPPGGAWTILCTVAAAPYSCSWNTQGGPDSGYSLRAVATDNSGLTGISATVATTVANTFVVALTGPGDIQRGTVNLSATLHNPGSTLCTVRVEYSMAGTNKWSTLCQNLTAPYNCTWATGTFANDFFDLRAVAITRGWHRRRSNTPDPGPRHGRRSALSPSRSIPPVRHHCPDQRCLQLPRHRHR